MKNVDAHSQRWDDLVFETRNRKYGAYVIRKSYREHVLEGMLCSILLAGGAILLPRLISVLAPTQLKPAIIPTVIFLLPPPSTIIPNVHVKPVIAPPQHVAAARLPDATAQVVTDDPVEFHSDAVTSTDASSTGEAFSTGDVQTGAMEQVNAVELPVILNFAEVMPIYKGGTSAMIRFIARELRYPGVARRMGLEGTVFVEFVIDAEGEVTQIKVLKGISPECDAETIRVVGAMTRWKAGLQNRIPVAVRMVLPIRFRLEK